MARVKENTNITRNAALTAAGEANQSYGEFQQNLGTLERGGSVAANPWKSADYLSNVNRLQSGALNSATDAGVNEIQNTNRRTGGLNSGATIGAIKDITGQKMRLGNQLSAERASNDFGKNVNYQTQVATMPLDAYSAAMQGESSADSALLGQKGNDYVTPAISAGASVLIAI